MRLFFYILIALAGGMLCYIRLAPAQVASWHVPVVARENKDLEGGAIRVIADEGHTMAHLEAAMLSLPRTTLLAGSAAQGRMTFVTRTKWIGFPDYTTIEKSGDQIKLFARLRFGRKDFGVNRARLEALIKSLQI